MRRLRPSFSVAAAAILFTAALTISLPASAPPRTAAPPAQIPVSDSANYVGPGSCSAVACHGAIRAAAGGRILQTEYSTWVAQDRHAGATEVLGHNISQRMGRILGLGNPQQAQKCLACHLGTPDKFVDHEMIAAGHPDLVFELEAFSAAMPRHWKETAAADAYRPVRTFAVGQLVHLRASLDRLARRLKGPAWPEYAELDCFTCHHSLTRAEDSWRQAQGYENRARPGLPQLQVSRYLTARRVLQAWDAVAAPELDGVMAKLQIEASRLDLRPGEVVALAAQARGIVDRGITRALAGTATADMASAMLRGIFADAPAIAERGERAAEQAAMAVEVLATALAKARGQDAAPLKATFTELFPQFESPSSFDPRKFTAAMKKAESAIPGR